jgi:DNA processing protein
MTIAGDDTLYATDHDQTPLASTADGELPERAYWVAFHHVPYIGPARLRRLVDHFGALEIAWKASEPALRRCLEERPLQELLKTRHALDLTANMASLERDGVRITTPVDVSYPALLQEIGAPPPVLYYRGELLETDRMAVAIVGTRRVTSYGRDMASRIAGDLARAGVTIVSGLARGVDGVAHQAALDAGGRTIAVLGSGVNRIYPPEHRNLARRIAEQGAIVSDYLPDTPPDGVNFPPRNRIISGLSLGVVVIEAPDRSGALITVDFAADHGRDVFAVPGPATATNSAGCNRIIREGARLVRNAEDVLEDLQIARRHEAVAIQQALPMNEEDRRLLAVLSSAPQHIDDLAALSDSPVAAVSARLMTLELQGLVRNAGAQHYTRA